MSADLHQLYNLEAEMSVLASIFIKDEAAEQVFGILEPEDFYHPAHLEIYKAMHQLAINYKPIDLVTLKDELSARGKLVDVGGEDYLIQMGETVPSAANAVYYANIVKGRSLVRSLNGAGHTIVKLTHDVDLEPEEKLSEAEAALFKVSQRKTKKQFKDARSIAKDYMIDVDNLMDTGEPTLGMPSGFYDLDKMTTGFYGGTLSIVAARPSMGKTALVLKIALNVARKGQGAVAIFSLEMSDAQLGRRLVSMVSRIPSNVLKKSDLTIDTYQKLANACESIYELPIEIDESSGITALEMRGKCRALKRESGLSMVIVDYLQLMNSGTKRRGESNRVLELGEISSSLKGLAKELDVPVIALSQLNRNVESRENKRPQLSDMRDSGAIEENADLVMFIYRDNYYKARENPDEADLDPDRTEIAELIIGKNRDGAIGTVEVAFQPKFASFENLAGFR